MSAQAYQMNRSDTWMKFTNHAAVVNKSASTADRMASCAAGICPFDFDRDLNADSLVATMFPVVSHRLNIGTGETNTQVNMILVVLSLKRLVVGGVEPVYTITDQILDSNIEEVASAAGDDQDGPFNTQCRDFMRRRANIKTLHCVTFFAQPGLQFTGYSWTAAVSAAYLFMPPYAYTGVINIFEAAGSLGNDLTDINHKIDYFDGKSTRLMIVHEGKVPETPSSESAMTGALVTADQQVIHVEDMRSALLCAIGNTFVATKKARAVAIKKTFEQESRQANGPITGIYGGDGSTVATDDDVKRIANEIVSNNKAYQDPIVRNAKVGAPAQAAVRALARRDQKGLDMALFQLRAVSHQAAPTGKATPFSSMFSSSDFSQVGGPHGPSTGKKQKTNMFSALASPAPQAQAQPQTQQGQTAAPGINTTLKLQFPAMSRYLSEGKPQAIHVMNSKQNAMLNMVAGGRLPPQSELTAYQDFERLLYNVYLSNDQAAAAPSFGVPPRSEAPEGPADVEEDEYANLFN